MDFGFDKDGQSLYSLARLENVVRHGSRRQCLALGEFVTPNCPESDPQTGAY